MDGIALGEAVLLLTQNMTTAKQLYDIQRTTGERITFILRRDPPEEEVEAKRRRIMLETMNLPTGAISDNEIRCYCCGRSSRDAKDKINCFCPYCGIPHAIVVMYKIEGD